MQDSTHLIAEVSRISHTRTPLPFHKSDLFLSVGECMSHLIISLFKYKLKLMRVDRHIMHWFILNWTSLNNTYCQNVYNPVEMFISAFLCSCMMASCVRINRAVISNFDEAFQMNISLFVSSFICLFIEHTLLCDVIWSCCGLFKCYSKHLSWLLKCIVMFSRTALRFLWFLADTCSGLCLFGTVPSQALGLLRLGQKSWPGNSQSVQLRSGERGTQVSRKHCFEQ